MKATLRYAGVKAFRTFVQTLAGILSASGAGLIEADWAGSLSAAGMAGLIAFLMNAGDGSGDPVDRPAPGGPVHGRP